MRREEYSTVFEQIEPHTYKLYKNEKKEETNLVKRLGLDSTLKSLDMRLMDFQSEYQYFREHNIEAVTQIFFDSYTIDI